MTLEEDMVSDQQSRPRIENTINRICMQNIFEIAFSTGAASGKRSAKQQQAVVETYCGYNAMKVIR